MLYASSHFSSSFFRLLRRECISPPFWSVTIITFQYLFEKGGLIFIEKNNIITVAILI